MCHCSLAVRDLAALEAKTLFTLEVCREEQLNWLVLHSLGTILQRGWDVKHYWADWKPQALFTDPCSCSGPGEVLEGTILRLCFERGL